MNSKILTMQDADPESFQWKVEVYGFSLSSRLPTIIYPTHLFLHWLTNKSNAIVMSPNGGIVENSYFKLVSKLKSDDGRGCYMGKDDSPSRRKSTDEDTKRFWLLNDSNFLAELSQKGWMIFPAAEEMDEYEKKTLGLTSDHVHHRKFSLKDLIRVMEVTPHVKGEYDKPIQDLRELSPFANTLNFVYGGYDGWGGVFLNTSSPKHSDEKTVSLNLKLDGLETILDPNKRGANPMRRVASFNGNFSDHVNSHGPRWWTNQNSNRILELIKFYFEKEGIKSTFTAMSVDANGFRIGIADRDYETIASAPDTGRLLEQATKTAGFVKGAIDVEVLDHEKQMGSVLNERKKALGLTEVKKD